MKKLLTLGLGALFAVSMAMPAFAEQPICRRSLLKWLAPRSR